MDEAALRFAFNTIPIFVIGIVLTLNVLVPGSGGSDAPQSQAGHASDDPSEERLIHEDPTAPQVSDQDAERGRFSNQPAHSPGVRLAYIDALKAFLAALVVLHHVTW